MTQASVLKITSPKEIGGKNIVTHPRQDNTLFKEVMAKTELSRDMPHLEHNKPTMLSSPTSPASLQNNPDRHPVKTDKAARSGENIDDSRENTKNIDTLNLETSIAGEEEALGGEVSSQMGTATLLPELEGGGLSEPEQVTLEVAHDKPLAVELKEPAIGHEAMTEKEILETPSLGLEKESLQTEKPTEESTRQMEGEEPTPVATVMVPLQQFNYDDEEEPHLIPGYTNEAIEVKEQDSVASLALQENKQGTEEELKADAKNFSPIDTDFQSKVENEAKDIGRLEHEENYFENQSLKSAIPSAENTEAKAGSIPKDGNLSSEEEVKKNILAHIAEALTPGNGEESDLSDSSFSNNPGDFDSNLLDEGLVPQMQDIEFGGLLTIDQGQLSVTFDGVENKPFENVPHRTQQISIAIREALSHGRGQVSVSLYPEALGQVDVKIEFAKMGTEQVITSIKILADRPETLKLLGEGVDYLKSSIKEVVKTADNASLSLDLRQGDNSNGAARDAEEHQESLLGRIKAENNLPQEEGIVRQYTVNKITTDSVDIRI